MKQAFEAIFGFIGVWPAGILEAIGITNATKHTVIIGVITVLLSTGIIGLIIKIVMWISGNNIKKIK